MMTTVTIFALVASYVVIAVLLLSINLASRWRWWVKAGAIIVTTFFFGVSYAAIYSVLGWPTDSRLPNHFQVHWGKVVEPNKFTGAPGVIYLWVEELDANNIPMGVPRAHQLDYTEDLAARVLRVIDLLQDGMEISGTAEVMDRQDNDAELGEVGEDAEKAGGDLDVESFPDDPFAIQFREMPMPLLPEKDVI